MIVISKRNLMLADVLFVLAFAMIYSTNGLVDYPIILAPLLIVAFSACIVRHISHFKLTRKIY